MKKVLITVGVFALLVGGFVVANHVHKAQDSALLVQPQSDPGAGGGRIGG